MAIIGGIPHFQTYPDGGINSKCRIQPLRAPWIQVSDFEAPVVGLRCCAAPPHPILGTLKRGGGDGSSQRWVIEEKKKDFCVNMDDVSLYHRLALYDFDGFSTT